MSKTRQDLNYAYMTAWLPSCCPQSWAWRRTGVTETGGEGGEWGRVVLRGGTVRETGAVGVGQGVSWEAPESCALGEREGLGVLML